ncbi:hypothetical protein JCM10213_000012 [Rhodosporidiobolus nylandii]
MSTCIGTASLSDDEIADAQSKFFRFKVDEDPNGFRTLYDLPLAGDVTLGELETENGVRAILSLFHARAYAFLDAVQRNSRGPPYLEWKIAIARGDILAAERPKGVEGVHHYTDRWQHIPQERTGRQLFNTPTSATFALRYSVRKGQQYEWLDYARPDEGEKKAFFAKARFAEESAVGVLFEV